MRPGTAILISSEAGTAGGLGFAGERPLSRLGTRLLTSTTCSRVTLGGRLSGIVKSPWSVVSRAVTFGDATGPAIVTVPLAVENRFVAPDDAKTLQRHGNIGGGAGAAQTTEPCAARLPLAVSPAENSARQAVAVPG